MSKVAAHFHKKSNMFMYSFKQPSKEKGKIFKKDAVEPHLEPNQISMMKRFCKKYNGQKLHHRCLILF